MTLPIPYVLDDEETLDAALQLLNENGMEPVLVGLDSDGTRFLAYGYAPGGDDWAVGVVTDDPYSREFDYDGEPPRCSRCNSEGRRDTDIAIRFPVVCI